MGEESTASVPRRNAQPLFTPAGGVRTQTGEASQVAPRAVLKKPVQ